MTHAEGFSTPHPPARKRSLTAQQHYQMLFLQEQLIAQVEHSKKKMIDSSWEENE